MTIVIVTISSLRLASLHLILLHVLRSIYWVVSFRDRLDMIVVITGVNSLCLSPHLGSASGLLIAAVSSQGLTICDPARVIVSLVGISRSL